MTDILFAFEALQHGHDANNFRVATEGLSLGGVRNHGHRAMPSVRALLVASLLTEPPYGCLGPSGNDRYRKRSLRSQTARASQVNCRAAAAPSQ
jgi:hypothetical protein